MIVVYEPVCIGFQHAEFNSFFLNVVKESFDNDILFISEKEHGNIVKKRLEGKCDRISYEERSVHTDSDKYHRFFRIYSDYKKLFAKIKSDGVNTLVVTVTREYELIIVNLLARKYKSVRILMLFHAHLNRIMEKPVYKRILLSFTAENVGYIVLSKNIKQAICNLAPQLQKKIISIHHALPSEQNICHHTLHSTNINFGFIGIATQEKGEDSIIEIVKKCKGDNVHFHYCGVVNDSELVRKMKESGIVVHGGTQPLSFEKYFESIRDLDYVILLLRKKSYKFRVSGTLIDAVNNEKPIITLSNQYTDEIFDEFGNIGYLCESEKDVCEVINKISSEFDSCIYHTQVACMKKMKETLSIDFLSRELKEQLKIF